MTLLHFDAGYNFVQEVPERLTGSSGYGGLNCQSDLTGGYAGAYADLSIGDRAAVKKIKGGHFFAWLQHQHQMYVGKVVQEPDLMDLQLVLSGPVAQWKRVPFTFSFGGLNTTDGYVKWLLSNLCPAAYGVDTADQQYIKTGAYTFATAPHFNGGSDTIGSALDMLNKFEGYEYGAFIPCPGHNLQDGVRLFFRSPDVTTLNFIVDVRRLKQQPKFTKDMSNFGTEIHVKYGSTTPPSEVIVNASAAAQAEWGSGIPYTIDISGTNTTTNLAQANQVAQVYLNSLMIHGVEWPPISTEITLDDNSHLIALKGCTKNIMDITPGMNFLLVGMPESPMDLLAPDNKTFMKATIVKKEQGRKVTISGNRYFNPAVILAEQRKGYK